MGGVCGCVQRARNRVLGVYVRGCVQRARNRGVWVWVTVHGLCVILSMVCVSVCPWCVSICPWSVCLSGHGQCACPSVYMSVVCVCVCLWCGCVPRARNRGAWVCLSTHFVCVRDLGVGVERASNTSVCVRARAYPLKRLGCCRPLKEHLQPIP